jgi:NAD(P)-dependent dehydrogenase (short-subunit alcohol dehydrogenase family)
MVEKVALIAGAAQGLGAATAQVLAKRGWVVCLADINAEGTRRIAETCAALTPGAAPIIVDLATENGADDMVAQALAAGGRLDVLINCAAFAPAEDFLAMTARSWELALLVNVRATALAMAAAGRAMRNLGGGRIINVTSAAARMALPHYAAYAATKAAVDALTRSGAVASPSTAFHRA